MSNRRLGLTVGVVAIGVLAGGYFLFGTGALKSGRSAAWTVPLAVPMGITVIDVPTPSGQFLWQRLGDASGKPLYTYDKDDAPDRSNCTGECSELFVPFIAPANAVAENDWTILTRDDGSKQWVYQGKPLYSYTGDDPPDVMSDGQPLRGGNRDEALFDPASPRYSPEKDWRRAAFTPDKSMSIPAGLELRTNAVANGYVFINSMNNKVVYALSAPPKQENALNWAPIYAPNVGISSMDDFTAVTGSDGKRHWHYKGYPLYTFNGDYSPSDLNGLNAERGVSIAMAYRNYMPDSVQITWLPAKGPFLVTGDGLTLYTQLGYRLQYGGRFTRDQYRYTYGDAKHIGTAGCVDECTEVWRPFVAPADAQPSGFWEIETRADGTRQWSYKGAPLYTHRDDKKEGDLYGNNIIDVVYGDPEGKVDLSLTTVDNPAVSSDAGSAFYWRSAALIN